MQKPVLKSSFNPNDGPGDGPFDQPLNGDVNAPIFLDWDKIDYIIWDLDGTLTPENEDTAVITSQVMTMVFREFLENEGIEASPEVLFNLASQPHVGKFEDNPLFQAYADQVDLAKFFSPAYHDSVHEAMIDVADMHDMPAFCPETRGAFETLLPFSTQFILTHSSRAWTEFVLSRIDHPSFKDPDLNDQRIYDFARVGFKSKAAGSEAIQQICNEHGLDPSRGLFVENSSANLKPAHGLGFQTVLFQGQGGNDCTLKTDEQDNLPPHITACFGCVSDLAEHYDVHQKSKLALAPAPVS